MKCYRHPDRATIITCQKCGQPICTKCLVDTPVGGRCPVCAKVRRLPTFQVSRVYLLRASIAGLGIGIIAWLAWGFIQRLIPFFYLTFLLGAAIGYGIGEVISLSVNRKRGTELAIIAGLAVPISYLVPALIFPAWYFSIFDLIAIGIGIFVSVSRLR